MVAVFAPLYGAVVQIPPPLPATICCILLFTWQLTSAAAAALSDDEGASLGPLGALRQGMMRYAPAALTQICLMAGFGLIMIVAIAPGMLDLLNDGHPYIYTYGLAPIALAAWLLGRLAPAIIIAARLRCWPGTALWRAWTLTRGAGWGLGAILGLCAAFALGLFVDALDLYGRITLFDLGRQDIGAMLTVGLVLSVTGAMLAAMVVGAYFAGLDLEQCDSPKALRFQPLHALKNGFSLFWRRPLFLFLIIVSLTGARYFGDQLVLGVVDIVFAPSQWQASFSARLAVYFAMGAVANVFWSFAAALALVLVGRDRRSMPTSVETVLSLALLNWRRIYMVGLAYLVVFTLLELLTGLGYSRYFAAPSLVFDADEVTQSILFVVYLFGALGILAVFGFADFVTADQKVGVPAALRESAVLTRDARLRLIMFLLAGTSATYLIWDVLSRVILDFAPPDLSQEFVYIVLGEFSGFPVLLAWASAYFLVREETQRRGP